MSSPALFRLVFVLYCVEAGIFFVTAPWLPSWERLAFSLPWSAARDALLTGWLRGAVTGFGCLHWVWAVHDVDLYFRQRAATTVDSRAQATTSETAGGR
jgi:hypothetical protein